MQQNAESDQGLYHLSDKVAEYLGSIEYLPYPLQEVVLTGLCWRENPWATSSFNPCHAEPGYILPFQIV